MVQKRNIEGFERFRCPKCNHNFFEFFIFDDDWAVLKCEFCHEIQKTNNDIPIKTLLKIFFNNNKDKYTAKYISEKFNLNYRYTSQVLLNLFKDCYVDRYKEENKYIYFKK